MVWVNHSLWLLLSVSYSILAQVPSDACKELITHGNILFQQYMGMYDLQDSLVVNHAFYKHETHGKKQNVKLKFMLN